MPNKHNAVPTLLHLLLCKEKSKFNSVIYYDLTGLVVVQDRFIPRAPLWQNLNIFPVIGFIISYQTHLKAVVGEHMTIFLLLLLWIG